MGGAQDRKYLEASTSSSLSVVCIIDVIRLSFIVIYNLINRSCDIKILIYFFFNSTLTDDFYFTYIDISNPVDYRGYVCDVKS
jgi:hypothetical protein